MTELSFLIELLLNHDVPKVTKDLIAGRIKEVESKLQYVPSNAPGAVNYMNIRPATGQQAASTLALMAKHGDLDPNVIVPVPAMPPVEPVVQIAQTPAAAVAMNSRNIAISESIAGKVDKQTGRPRKF